MVQTVNRELILPNSFVYLHAKYLNSLSEYFIFKPALKSKTLVLHESSHFTSSIQKELFLIVCQNIS